MRPLLVAFLAAAPAVAPAAEPDLISEPEWRSLVLGKTLVYRDEGVFAGLERYAATGNRVEWQFPDGTCTTGRWEKLGDMYCFDWEQMGLQCYRHLRDGDKILIEGTDLSPTPGDITEVTAITDQSLICDAPMS